MPVYVVTPRTGMVRTECSRSRRMIVATDAGAKEDLPRTVLSAVDEVSTRALSFAPPGEADHANARLVWMAGEKLLAGSGAELRRALYSSPPVDCNVVVNIPYIQGGDLLSVQPRLLLKGATGSWLHSGLRIEGVAKPSPSVKRVCEAVDEPWAHLYLALLSESNQVGGSLDALKELWQRPRPSLAFAALILRNMIVVLLRLERYEQATDMLTLAAKAFPDYPEVHYLQALLWIRQGMSSKAIAFLEGALHTPSNDFPGSGGENSYRALHLLGQICEGAGQQEKAVRYWIPGIHERPAFGESVRDLLNQRMPPVQAEQLLHPLGELARREPAYAEPVVHFFLEHGLTRAAARLFDSPDLDPAVRTAIEARVAAADACGRRRPAGSLDKPGIVLNGPFLMASAHARINEAVGLSLLGCPELDAALETSEWPMAEMMARPTGEALWNGMTRRPSHTDLTIRHLWPPNFRKPGDGKLVCVLPWEHTAVPLGWVRDIQRDVDELWVPSDFVRRAFVAGGVSPERVRVLTNGVDARVFQPAGVKFRPAGCRGFVFLFVGGTILRKGIDLLLQAYGDAFTREEDVTLVVKDFGSRTFYSQNTRLGEVQAFSKRASSPHTMVLTEQFDDAGLAALYRGADALVLPYRGEGFAMPLLEAMACGTPVISTAAGPVIEYCAPEDAFLVPAQEVPVPVPPPPLGAFSGPWTWFEPDVTVLAQTLRRVFQSREDAALRGARAGERVRRELDWEQVLPAYHQRIRALTRGGA